MEKLPLQPIYTDENGRKRFRKNELVRYLLDNGGLDLNKLGVVFSDAKHHDDWEQFAQLIGYSLAGFSELEYVSNETFEAAQIKSGGIVRTDAARAELPEQLSGVYKEMMNNSKTLDTEITRIISDDFWEMYEQF